MSKVSIIGAGEVGASCATCLAERDFVNEIIIVDVMQGLAEGNALDLRQSAAVKRFDTIVKCFTGDYPATANSDVVVITAGAPRKPGMERSDLLTTNAKIVSEVSRQVAKCYTSIGGIPIRNLMDEAKVQDAIHRTQLGGEEIIGHLGRSGWYAAVSAVCEMVESVICDQRRVFPACAYLKGEYGYEDIYLGVPVIIGKNGVEKVIELELDPDDKEHFDISQRNVRTTLEIMKKLAVGRWPLAISR